MGLLQGGLLSHQALAITAFTAFMGDSSGDPAPMAATLTATVGRVLREHRAVGQAIMAQLAHNHPHHDAGEEGGGREQMCARMRAARCCSCAALGLPWCFCPVRRKVLTSVAPPMCWLAEPC